LAAIWFWRKLSVSLNAGNDRFADFFCLGVPMTVVAGTVTVPVIPVSWPLSAD
jgi:di/tricarboxylate transporter